MNSFSSEVGSRGGVLWPSLIEQFERQGLLVEPIQTEVNLLDLAARSEELSEWVQCIRPQWRCLNNHEVRVFLIRSPDGDSVVWISWLGRRGSRWHVTQHFPIDGSKLSLSHQDAADELTVQYQEAWDLVAQTKD